MRIAFYAPFKPLNHPNYSGDLVIGQGLYTFLKNKGHSVVIISRLRTRWIYGKPWLWPKLLVERQRIVRKLTRLPADCWLTFHTYYKGPDILGPLICGRLNMPYVIFQGIYATKRGRRFHTWPGYKLNTYALQKATHVFSNKEIDFHNLGRIIPPRRLSYIVPGLELDKFGFDFKARAALRRHWRVEKKPVIITAAMFRPGVKTRGLMAVIKACGRIGETIKDLQLVILGDGQKSAKLRAAANKFLPGRVRFEGRVVREKIYRYFSAADVFAFPGINESLGMVFLEAQACGLPVVAFDNAGVPEAVKHGKTGLLVPLGDIGCFTNAIKTLVTDKGLRQRLGAAARTHVQCKHDLNLNYRQVADRLEGIVRHKKK